MNEQAKTERMPLSARIAALLVSPVKLMQNIKLYPVALVPLVICAAINLLYYPVSQDYTKMVTEDALRKTSEMLGVDMATLQSYNPIASGEAGLPIGSILIGLLSIPVSVFLSALGTFLVCKAAKGPAKLNRYFSIYAHLFIISTVATVAVSAISIRTNNLSNMMSLMVLTPNAAQTDLLSVVLSSVSVGSVWTTVLAIVGIRVINDWQPAKAVIVGLIAFVLSIAALLLIQVLSSSVLYALNGMMVS